MCAEGVIEYRGKAAFRLNQAYLNATGVIRMIGKNLIRSRGLMIAIAVIALMTLTAGVAAAAANKAKNIEAVGGVGVVALSPGGTVESKFRINKKTGEIKSVKIKTVGEVVGGAIGAVTNCEEKGKHSAGACAAVEAILIGSSVLSIHASTATLKVIAQPNPFLLVGTVRGSLKAKLTLTALGGEELVGSAKLRIRNTALPSVYGCLVGVDIVGNPIFDVIQVCIDAPGPNSFLFPVAGGPPAGPVMASVELHVTDTGRFNVASDMTEMKGKLSVTVDFVGGVASGPIFITKGQATFAHDHD